MLERAINCLDPRRFEKIHLVVTDQVLNEFNLDQGVFRRIFEDYLWSDNLTLTVIPGASFSQLETVSKGVRLLGLTGPLLVKDCDNEFNVENLSKYEGKNAVVTQLVEPNSDFRRLQQKSFVKMVTWKGGLTEVQEIAEKKIISDRFCVGAYLFKHATHLVEAHVSLLTDKWTEGKELYMSHAIDWLIKQNREETEVIEIPCSNYQDWGTIHEWKAYCAQYKTLIVDLDGVVFQNGSRVMAPRWGTNPPLLENVGALKSLPETVSLVFMTARPERYRKVTERQLRDLGFLDYHSLVMGVPHGMRVLINDYSGLTAPYPMAQAINVKRDSMELFHVLGGI